MRTVGFENCVRFNILMNNEVLEVMPEREYMGAYVQVSKENFFGDQTIKTIQNYN